MAVGRKNSVNRKKSLAELEEQGGAAICRNLLGLRGRDGIKGTVVGRARD